MWEDGASFEWLLINYAGLDFPPGMGPFRPGEVVPSLFNNATLAARLAATENSVA